MRRGGIDRTFEAMLTYSLEKLLVEAHADDLRREADRRRLEAQARSALRRVEETAGPSITIRIARPDDARALLHLAELDSAGVPPAPVLLAEADGELSAALSLRDGSSIADPFRRTAGLRQLLQTRAGQLRVEPRRRWRLHVLRHPAGARPSLPKRRT
jgi:hypothetical protein